MAEKPDKTDEHTTPTGENPAHENPVYDSLVDTGEPVVATVDPEPEAARTPPPLVEPEEIVVEPSNSSDYLDEPSATEREHEPVAAEPEQEPAATRAYDRAAAEPAREPEPEPMPVPNTRVIDETPAAAPYPSQPQVVYVNAPQAPTAKGNRGFGVLIAIAATIVFQIVLTIVMAIVYSSLSGGASFGFIAQAAFYVPALFFFIGMVALVLILNRAGWWTYVIGSILVALFVYFGTIGALLLGSSIILQTPDVAAALFREGLSNPFTIAAALVAREIAIWVGAIIASRGRKVKGRNAEAKAAFENEQAQKRSH
ncbi:MAG: hypothetical protein JWM50_1194 [Microbacteriaceae bacterium]|jgi:hypothetical protein|nr:hypothetical protein [Microbacteriaceae bacterium]